MSLIDSFGFEFELNSSADAFNWKNTHLTSQLENFPSASQFSRSNATSVTFDLIEEAFDLVPKETENELMDGVRFVHIDWH